MQKLSVVIITFNEERNIERCLRSVLWADEVIVVDAMSSDRTVEICSRFNVEASIRAWTGFAPQKQYAVSLSSHPWVLIVDADEEVTDELKNEIRKTLSSQTEYDGYNIARKSFFLGQWMRHGGWYPGYQLRLFKKAKASISQRPVHEGVELNGKASKLLSPFNHFTYYSLSQYLTKLNDYTSLDVMNKLNRTRRRRVRWYNLMINPIAVFFRMFIVLSGFRDGFRGFLLAFYSSLYKLLLFAKVWEYQTAQERGQAPPPVSSAELESLKRFS
jgi:glycosyltransferase involved in cell wall biosynthesis